MKIFFLSQETFTGAYREYFEDFKEEMNYLEYLKLNEKAYTHFVDELCEAGIKFEDEKVKSKILEIFKKYIDPKMFYIWVTENNFASKKFNLGDEHIEDYVFSEVLPSNIKNISTQIRANCIQILSVLEHEIFSLEQYSKLESDIRKTESDKIIINGNIQLLGFIFNELINKGYITPPKHNGKVSPAKFAKQLLKHFEFTTGDNNKQPSENYLTKALRENKYSINKQETFKIPHIRTSND